MKQLRLITLAFSLFFMFAYSAAAEDDVASYFWSNVGKLKVKPKEESKLGPFMLGQIIEIQKNENDIKILNPDCGFTSKSASNNEQVDFAVMFCQANILGEERELRIQLFPLAKIEASPFKAVIGSISLSMFNPDKQTVNAMGEAILRRWGLPKSTIQPKTSNKRAEEIAKICNAEIGPLETLSEYMARDECRAVISANPLVQFVNSASNTNRVIYSKNGVQVELFKAPVNFMFVQGTNYTLRITTDELLKFDAELSRLQNNLKSKAEKTEREIKIKSF